MSDKNLNWDLKSYESKVYYQKVEYENSDLMNDTISKIRSFPPLLDFHEVECLRQNLICCEEGNGFVIQLGDCAESFEECTQEAITKKVELIQNVQNCLKELNVLIVPIGRIAGQYGKPRTNKYENFEINEKKILTYRGDNINSISLDDREPDPLKILQGYHHSTATQNYLRSCIKNKDEFIYTSHEGLVLEYEESLAKLNPSSNLYYDLSAHFLWIGDRTRNIDGAHIEFFRGMYNPIGIKIGPSIDTETFINTIQTLNPQNQKGKIIVILRFGIKNQEKTQQILRSLVNVKKNNGLNLLWMCDPCHGNTYNVDQNIKTRKLSDLLLEIQTVIQILNENQEKLSGIHLETTPFDVTECLGGTQNTINENDLHKNYTSKCDPRLNYLQTIEITNNLKNLIKSQFLQR